MVILNHYIDVMKHTLRQKILKGGKIMSKAVCIECGAINDYEIRNGIREYEGEGYHFTLDVQEAVCRKCGSPIWIDEIENEISERANEIIRKQRGIISKEEIVSIVNKYNASQKFLSRILGWGEITLTRYITGGYTPNATNSHKLRELKNPYIVQDLLIKKCEETDGEIVKEKSFGKMQTKINEEIDILENKEKIYQIVDWYLIQTTYENPMTHLALQKLLYFSQSWCKVLTGKWLFENDCQAWVHGAVYPEVYEQFKPFKYNPLPKVKKEIKLASQELQVLMFVKKFYFDVYNARGLENICHNELPYKEARNGCADKEVGKRIIAKESIEKYYKEIVKQYNIRINEEKGIKEYLNQLV